MERRMKRKERSERMVGERERERGSWDKVRLRGTREETFRKIDRPAEEKRENKR